MKERVLILGASLLQKRAIEAAHELALEAVVIDANENALCVPLADRFEKIDLKDEQAIFEFAKKLKNEAQGLKGIFTCGTDFSKSVSFAGEKLSFACHSYEASVNASSKIKMRERFSKNKIPSPQFFSVTKTEIENKKIFDFAKKLSFPCVAKPSDNMGSRGCKMILSEDEIESSLLSAVKNSRTETALIEEFMDGDEFSIDALIYKDTMTITGFADRHIFFPPYFVELGHTLPSEITNEKKLKLIETFSRACAALGLTCGAAKADIKWTKDGAKVGEIAARLSGGYMSGWTFPYASDFNLTKEALLIATGCEPNELLEKRIPLECENVPFQMFEIPANKTSSERALISIDGIVSKIIDVSKNKNENVHDVFFRVEEGSEVSFPTNNVEKCANVISVSTDRNTAIFASEEKVSNLVLRLEANNEKTKKFFLNAETKNFPPSFFPLCDLEKVAGFIPENKKVSEYVPDVLQKIFESDVRDANYRSLKKSCEIFDELCPRHPRLEKKEFWKKALLGGVQGMLFFADTITATSSENT